MTDKRRDSQGNELFCGEYEKSDGRYAFRYRTRDGKVKWLYAQRLSKLRVMEARVMYHEYLNISEKIRDLTLNDQFELWISGKLQLRESTKASYRFLYDTYIRYSLGKELLDDISTFRIKSHYTSLVVDRRISVETVSHIQNVLYQVFQSGVEREVICYNPATNACKEFKRSHSKHVSKRPGLYKYQAVALLDFLKRDRGYGRWYPLIYLFIYTGLRLSEMAGLRWSDVDFDKKVVDVNHTVIYCTRGYGNASFHVFPPKTTSGYRNIPIGMGAIEALDMEKEYQNKSGVSCTKTIDGYNGFIFSNRFGGIITQSSVNRALERIVLAFNNHCFKDTKGEDIIIPKITSHSLRHTFANILCEENVNVKVVQTLMGHSDIETTMNIYTKVHGDFLMREYMEKVWSKE